MTKSSAGGDAEDTAVSSVLIAPRRGEVDAPWVCTRRDILITSRDEYGHRNGGRDGEDGRAVANPVAYILPVRTRRPKMAAPANRERYSRAIPVDVTVARTKATIRQSAPGKAR